jgi:3-hydroxyisobutyrate dehydrogenase
VAGKRARRRRVAFIGLGTMGLPMARNLVAAGYRLVGHDLDPQRASEAGGEVALSPAEAANGADVVITSLPSPAAVEGVAFGAGGVHEGIAAGAAFVDMSTNAPARARDLAMRFAALGVGTLDAPVSGGPAGAKGGTLSIMVGGDAELFKRWLPLLRAMGRHVVRAGDSGAGQVAKLCNNQITGATMAAISEACAVAASESIDAAILYDILCNSVGDSRVLRTRFPLAGAGPGHPADNGYTPLFTLELLLKDLRLALELAEESGASTPLLRTVVDRYEAARAAGYGTLDYSAVHLLHGDAPEDSG